MPYYAKLSAPCVDPEGEESTHSLWIEFSDEDQFTTHESSSFEHLVDLINGKLPPGVFVDGDIEVEDTSEEEPDDEDVLDVSILD